ncbi:MAG TPA: GMC oxidoreductase, partial [Nitrososphaera sp.]|nr:GMC oxidoreductase [Nitrososphaera sp.]
PRSVLDYWNNAFGLNISIDEYQAAYQKIAARFGVTKVKSPGRGHELFKSGCEGLGYSADWMDKAYSQKGEKNNAFEAFLKWSKLENLTVFTNSKVDKVVFSNKKAIAVKGVFRHPSDRRQHNFSVSAKCFIICSGAIGSSELLLKSGYSGKNDQVGQHLSLHPSSSVLAQFDEEIDGESGVAMACYCDEFSVRKTEKPGFMLESVFVPPSQMSITLPSYGEENRKYLKKYKNYAMAGVLVQDEPNGQVELNWNQDAVVEYDLGKADQSKMVNGIKEAARIFFRAGAKSVLTGHMIPTRLKGIGDLSLVDSRGAGMGTLLLASAHPQGGNRMGQDPLNSVVNRYGQIHDIPNLFVCDSSIFPTSIGVNPQMTVMSIALLSSEYIESIV